MAGSIPAPPPPPQLAELLGRHGVALGVLFGSRARGEATTGSDLDVGVLHHERRPLSFRELGLLRLDLEELVGEPLDLVDLATPDVILRIEIARDGVVWFTASREVWTDFVTQALIDHDELGPWLEACAAGVTRRALRRGAA